MTIPLKLRVITDISWDGDGRSAAFVHLDWGDDWAPIFGPIDVTDLRGRDFEEDVQQRVGTQFAAALRAALEATS